MSSSARIVLGFDPGVSGAVAWLSVTSEHARLLQVADLPTASRRVGRSMKAHILLPAVASMVRDFSVGMAVLAFVEDVHAMPGQGVTSMFRFGHAAGALEGILAGLGVPWEKLRPRQWQSAIQVQSGPDAGRERVSSLWPHMAEKFVRKRDHNRADAALIAYAGACLQAGRRLYTGD